MPGRKAYTVTFWGTRGSVPTPGAHTARYGGNTPCVAVEGPAGQLVILDAGTGIRVLGRELAKPRNGGVRAEILLSHTHWDHIQGLPHFRPFFDAGNAVRIWGSQQGSVPLETILRQQMDGTVFPVPLDALAAKLTVQQVHGGGADFEVEGFTVSAFRLRHPGTTLAYRLTPIGGGASMAYATDNELGTGGNYTVADDWRQQLIKFFEGVELLVHDAMYTPEELDQHRGWGHSSWEEAVTLAADCGARRLALFHHEPDHDDAAIDSLVEQSRALAKKRGRSLDVLAAAEGLQLTL